jgi:CheY-like chemotaxis protein
MSVTKRALAADRPEGIDTLQNILKTGVDLLSATTLEAAVQGLQQPVDLIVCGVHFDDSRMFDLLIHVRADRRTRDTPFLIFRDLESELDTVFFKSMEIASKALGAAGFIDLHTLKRKHGVADADRQFRELIFTLMA